MKGQFCQVFVFATSVFLGSIGCQSAPKSTSERDDMRNEIRAMEKSTLEQLYTQQPAARTAMKGAAGYAVFSNFGMKILVTGGGSGEGVAVNNATGAATYMKMIELQAGVGMGVKKFKLIWIFETKEALDQFVNSGWTLGAQGTAAAQAGDKGGSYVGAVAVAPGVWVYQMTDTGLALELTAKGTKYYKNDDLN